MADQPRDYRGRFITSAKAAQIASDLEEVGLFAADMEGWIAGSAIVFEAKMAKAKEVQAYWQSIAPVRGDKDPRGSKQPTARGTDTEGDYRKSIKVTERDGTVAVGTDFFPLASWLEYGSVHNPEHGYGARVLAHFGGGPVDEGEKISKNLFVG